MTAEIVELRLPRKIVGEHLRCPVCDSRKAYVNIGAQSYGFCREHGVYWLVGQNFTDLWTRQSWAQWRVNAHHLAKMQRVYADTPQKHSDGDAA